MVIDVYDDVTRYRRCATSRKATLPVSFISRLVSASFPFSSRLSYSSIPRIHLAVDTHLHTN